MAYRRKRATGRGNSRTYQRRAVSRRSNTRARAPARRASPPQVIKIVIENPQPQMAPPAGLPGQVGNVQALTKPRGARF